MSELEVRFVERFGALVLTRGWHCLHSGAISEYGWKDPSWVSPFPWDTYEARRIGHLEAIHQIIDWPKIRESDFEIGWWSKFLGTAQGTERTQLIKVMFPLTKSRRGAVNLLWAAELDMSEAIKAICSGIVIKDQWS